MPEQDRYVPEEALDQDASLETLDILREKTINATMLDLIEDDKVEIESSMPRGVVAFLTKQDERAYAKSQIQWLSRLQSNVLADQAVLDAVVEEEVRPRTYSDWVEAHGEVIHGIAHYRQRAESLFEQSQLPEDDQSNS